MHVSKHVAWILAVVFCACALPFAVAGAADRGSRVQQLPIADAGADVSGVVGTPVVIDGSRSHGPASQLIHFRWVIARAPAGSAATLDTADPAPVFIPDVPGEYLLQLVVVTEEGAASLPAGMTLIAFERGAAPNVRVGRDRHVGVGAPVDLDGRMSHDPRQRPLAFHWSFLSVPKASRLSDANIRRRETATPSFTPDVAGVYLIELEASNGELASEDVVTVTASTGNIPPVADAGKQQEIRDRVPFALNGAASFDPDLGPSPLGFAWRLVARPRGSVLESSGINDASSPSASVVPDAEGAYLFRLTVNDGDKADADNVLIRYAGNDLSGTSATNRESALTPLPVAEPPRTNVATPPESGRRRPPHFRLIVTPDELQIAPGSEGSLRVILRANRRSAGGGKLQVTGLPAGSTATFGIPVLAPGDSTTLTIRIGREVLTGTYPLRVTASGTAGDGAIAASAIAQVRVQSLIGASGLPTCAKADLSRLTGEIYVAPAGNDTPTCGAAEVSACATIQHGIDRCDGARCGVLVRHGRYRTTSTIKLRNAVSVYGSCLFGNEADLDPTSVNYRTLIDATLAEGPAISADSINTPTVVSGVVVLAQATEIASAPSIVMVASQSTGLTLTDSALIAGLGITGAKGADSAQGGVGGNGQSPIVFDGGVGGFACAANPSGGSGNGGEGGDQQSFNASDCGLYYCGCYDLNPNSLGRNGAASGAVAGGVGGTQGGPGCGCAYVNDVPPGLAGKPGYSGSCATEGGRPADAVGKFSGTTWVASTGGPGGIGSVGSGGGGGGAGGVTARANFGADPSYWFGFPAGGGGGGGCGGPGGAGGSQGGASIALVLVHSTMTGVDEHNAIVPGLGGAGGHGGNGGIGGSGGKGGTGWIGTTYMEKPAVCHAYVPGSSGDGGPGGQGGAGGGGASGSGGPSIGIALVAGSPDPGSTNVYSGLAGQPGDVPGQGGRNAPTDAEPDPCTGASGNKGVPGSSAQVVDFDKVSPGSMPLPRAALQPQSTRAEPNRYEGATNMTSKP